MSLEERICKLCFTMSDTEYKLIDDAARMMLDFLLIKLNWNLGEYSFICKDCEDTVKRSYYFKFTFMNKTKTEFELNDRHESNGIITFQDCIDICQFCSNQVESDKCFSVDHLLTEPKFSEMLPAFLPELDLDLATTALTCIPCGEKLGCYCTFVSNYLSIEDRINKYLEEKDITVSRLTSMDVHNFLFRNNDDLSRAELQPNEIKQEVDPFEEYKPLEVHYESVKNEDAVHVKDEPVSTDKYTGENRDLDIHLLAHRDNSDTKGYECELCPYETEQKSEIDGHNMSETGMYKCDSCPFSTKWRSSLIKHKLTHKDVSEVKMYKCDSCTYETKYKSQIDSHSLVHRDVSEIKMYKCDSCTFSTKWRNCLSKHKLIHKDASDVKMYKCTSCAFETKRKGSLRDHMLTHKETSEVKMYKCDVCTYETKWKSQFKKHQVIHEDNVVELGMYKCDSCTYETKYKRQLANHLLTHDNPEVTKYKCENCAFGTKSKKQLESHMRTHKATSDLKMYKCGSCPFEAKWKTSLRHHTLTHKNISELEMYKCASCSFETKWKSSLREHMLVHKDISKMKMDKSEVTYEAECKNRLNQQLVHVDLGVTKHKCEICSFETKRKRNLKYHMLTHKDISKAKNYKCEVFRHDTKSQN